jgi:methionyl aminopeptidase
MHPGHCFTIEPCLVQGDKSRGYGWPDTWTYATEVSPLVYKCQKSRETDRHRLQSNARSAQFEHQLLITKDGVDVLTRI